MLEFTCGEYLITIADIGGDRDLAKFVTQQFYHIKPCHLMLDHHMNQWVLRLLNARFTNTTYKGSTVSLWVHQAVRCSDVDGVL